MSSLYILNTSYKVCYQTFGSIEKKYKNSCMNNVATNSLYMYYVKISIVYVK